MSNYGARACQIKLKIKICSHIIKIRVNDVFTLHNYYFFLNIVKKFESYYYL